MIISIRLWLEVGINGLIFWEVIYELLVIIEKAEL